MSETVASTTIRIPAPLRPLTGGASEVDVEAATVGDALRRLGERHQDIVERILDDEGAPRPFVNIFLGDRNIRALGGLDAPLPSDSVISIVPAVAGGRR